MRCESRRMMHVVHAGTLVSTCQVQLVLAGNFLCLIVAALLHPKFWELVGDYYGWPVSFVLIFLWHALSQKLLNTYVTDGKSIRRPFVWLFAYVALSAAYCMVRPGSVQKNTCRLYACVLPHCELALVN